MTRAWLITSLGAVALLVVGAALYAADVTLRPPQALPFGTVIWWYETGFTVTGVERAKEIAFGGHRRHARGTYYIVDAKVIAPFGERYHWDDAKARVETFSGDGGTMRGLRFAVDEEAQALLDRSDGRPGPQHMVRGASQTERLVFDLPDDVEQPGLVFEDTLDPWNALDVIFGSIWEPHRFNLRYD
jgi:hypothetical protein